MSQCLTGGCRSREALMVVVAPGFDLFSWAECSPVGLTGFDQDWLNAFSAQSLTALCPSRTLERKVWGFFSF